MIPSNVGAMPIRSPHDKDAITDDGGPGPMPQQDVAGCHGHEIHPQKFVQLVGCHDSSTDKPKPVPGPRYRTAA